MEEIKKNKWQKFIKIWTQLHFIMNKAHSAKWWSRKICKWKVKLEAEEEEEDKKRKGNRETNQKRRKRWKNSKEFMELWPTKAMKQPEQRRGQSLKVTTSSIQLTFLFYFILHHIQTWNAAWSERLLLLPCVVVIVVFFFIRPLLFF